MARRMLSMSAASAALGQRGGMPDDCGRGIESRREPERIHGRKSVRRNPMSKRYAKVLLFLTGVVLFVCAVALAEKPKTINIYSDSVLPSGQELRAGEYQINVNETSKQVIFKRGSKVIGTASFQTVERTVKNSRSEARFDLKNDKQVLNELRFGGENRSIMLIQGGS